MEDRLTIALNGLAQGKIGFNWSLGEKFFGAFDNQEILDADICVEAVVEKSGRYVGVDCCIRGSVTVPCDRCLDPVKLPIDESVLLSVKFTQGQGEDAVPQTDGREILCLSEEDTELDLSQTVYDYICLAMPMVRVHEDGECNPEVVKYLCDDADRTEAEEQPSSMDSPFAALKTLLKD